MGAFDLLMAEAQTYRQHIIYSIEQDDLANTMAYIDGFYLVMYPHIQHPPQINAKPSHTGRPWEQFHEIETKWVIDSLKKVEVEMFATLVYHRRLPFIILQSVIGMYRQSVMFNLDHKRDTYIACGLIDIYNSMLPKGTEADIGQIPKRKKDITGISLETDKNYDNRLRVWARERMVGVEYALSTYIKRKMAVQQH